MAVKKTTERLKVEPYCINKGTSSQYFGLMATDSDGDKWVLRYAPNNWKTERGAVNWGRKHGYDVTVNGKRVKSSVRNSRKTKKSIKKKLSKMGVSAPKKTACRKTVKKK